jgi:hypothetical protein
MLNTTTMSIKERTVANPRSVLDTGLTKDRGDTCTAVGLQVSLPLHGTVVSARGISHGLYPSGVSCTTVSGITRSRDAAIQVPA